MKEDAASPPLTHSTQVSPPTVHGGQRATWALGLVLLVVAGAVWLLAGAELPTPTARPLADEPVLALEADFRDDALQGLRREPDGALVLDEAAWLEHDERPRAYADRAAFGVYVSPPVALARPVTHVEATLAADLPPAAQAVLEVRGAGVDGRWTPWVEV